MVLEQLVGGKVRAAEAALTLGLSRRQVLRLKRSFARQGAGSLVHGNRGRSPAHALDADTRDRIVDLSSKEYLGASYSHMVDLLAEHQDIHTSAKTIGRILKAANVSHKHTHKGPRKHRSRERMPQEGALVQLDASPHHWLEARGPRLTLHGAIDDAGSKIVGLHFAEQETTDGYLRVLWQVVSKHGVPARVYTDRHTLFTSSKELSLEEELAGKQLPLTQFGDVLDELGIGHVKARTPQAKGRVERLWGTLQERLVVEMRIADIRTVEQANEFLKHYADKHNKAFAVEAENPNPAWTKAPDKAQLANIIAIRRHRIASNGSCVSLGGKPWQLRNENGRAVALKPGATVDIRIRLDNQIRAIYAGKVWKISPLSEKTDSSQAPGHKENKADKLGYVPPSNHPWKRGLPSIKTRERVTFSLSH
jgi:transposase